MNDRSRSRIEDALEAAKAINEWVPIYDRARIESDLMVESGYIRQFEIIGEALRSVRDADETITELFPDIHEWISLRHHIIQEYRDVDIKLLWRYATVDIPLLIGQLQSLLKTQDDDT